MHLPHANSTVKQSGFTLVELLVAIGVTALLVSLMLSITVSVMGGWNRSSGTLTSGNQARMVLDQLSRDLQSVVIKRDGNVWFAATIQQNQTGTGDAAVAGANWAPTNAKPSGTATAITDNASLYTTAPSFEDYRFGQAGVWLRFFSSVADANTLSSNASAPRAIAYQIIRLPVVAGSSEFRYQLFRSEVSSNATFTAGYDLFAAASNYNSTTAPTVITDANCIRSPETSSSPGRQLVLANNVIDFGVRIYTRNSITGALNTTPAFPSGSAKGFAATTSTTVTPPAPVSGALSAADFVYSGTSTVGFPEVVEVFVRVLTDEGVNQIALFENPPSGYVAPGTWWDIALANSRVYTRRIELKTKGL